MFMKNFSKYLIVGTLIIALGSLAACKNGSTGLFESIAGETTTSLNPSRGFKQASIGSMARLGGNFYAAISSLWVRPVEGGIWKPVTLPTGFVYAESLVTAGSSMYAILRDGNGANPKIRSFDGDTWTDDALAITLSSGHGLRGLFAANNTIFAWSDKYDATVTEEANRYTCSLYVLSGGSFAVVGGLDNVVAGTPKNLEHDGTNYWLSTSKKVYAGSSSAMSAQTITISGDTMADSDSFGGMAFLNIGGTPAYTLTTASGKLYHSANGTSWTLPDAGNLPKNSNAQTYQFNTPVFLSYADNNLLLAPSLSLTTSGSTAKAKGYVLFRLADAATIARSTDYSPISDYINNDTSIGTSSIRFFAVFRDTPTSGKITLFAGTQENGLWSNSFDGSTWSKWLRESDR